MNCANKGVKILLKQRRERREKKIKKKITRPDCWYYIAALAGCAIFALLMLRAFSAVDTQVSAQAQEYRPVIIIDAGHGGEDGGASSKSGVLEKDINLAIALQLREYLSATGFEVVMTREYDRSIYDSGLDTIRQKKVSDLHNRLALIQQYPGCLFISIHQNQFSDSQYSGAQVFYSANHPQSKELAEHLRSAIVGLLQPENKRECKQAEKSIYLMHNAQEVAVLVECGFLSNPQEAAQLSSEDYQKQMAFAIYCGILDYWRGQAG